MEKYLKAIIVAAIMTMPWTYYISPQLAQIRAKRQQIANFVGSANRFSDGKDQMFKQLLQIQRENLKKETKRLSFLLPSFSNARANLMAPFETLRQSIDGDWKLTPEGSFTESNSLVYWGFSFSLVSTPANAIKAIAHIESSPQFMRLRRFSIETNGELVTMQGKVELVFHTVERLAKMYEEETEAEL